MMSSMLVLLLLGVGVLVIGAIGAVVLIAAISTRGRQ